MSALIFFFRKKKTTSYLAKVVEITETNQTSLSQNVVDIFYLAAHNWHFICYVCLSTTKISSDLNPRPPNISRCLAITLRTKYLLGTERTNQPQPNRSRKFYPCMA